MGLLCFVLDLPSLQPLLLNDIKRSLLHLANLCATTKRKVPPSSSRNGSINLAICCVDKASASGTYQLHTIYRPMESFNLRDCHHAVTSLLPSSALMSSCSQGQVSSLQSLIQQTDGLLSWVSLHSSKKIIMISSLFVESTASFEQMLLDAAERCIAIDFIQITSESSERSLTSAPDEQSALPDLSINILEFENCTFQEVAWDVYQFASLEKQWIQNFISDLNGPLDITLTFQEKLYKDRDTVFCSVHPLLIQLADLIQPCQTCRCHGAVLEPSIPPQTGNLKLLCPYTGQELDAHDFTSNGVKVGPQTILYLPSFKNPLEPARYLTSPRPSLAFTVLKCIGLNTLTEGLLFGDPYIVVPSSEGDWDDDDDNLEMNDSLFASLCQDLYSRDCGLLCTSTSDIDVMVEKSFSCYYLLLPAENQLFLARRITAAEEFLQQSPPELKNKEISKELKDSVTACLSKIGVEDYNPLNYERGIHSKLNWLAKESLQFCPMPAQRTTQNDKGQLPLSQKATPSNPLFDSQPNEASPAVNSRGLDKISERLTSSVNQSKKGRSLEYGAMHQNLMSMQTAAKSSTAMTSPALGGASSSSCFSELPLLPLKTCAKPCHSQMVSPRRGPSSKQMQSEIPKQTGEPTLLKAGFRRIKHGKL